MPRAARESMTRPARSPRLFQICNVAFGETRPLHGGRYGNMLMTRFPIVETRTHDITKSTREERGVLQCAIDVGRARR